LIDEVADLWDVLRLVDIARRPPEYRQRAPSLEEEEPAKGLDRLIPRTSAKLQQLDSLLEHHWSRTQRRMPDFSWVRGKQRADALRTELAQLRMHILTALSATACATVNRVESAFERFSFEQLKSTQQLASSVGQLTLKHQDPTSSIVQTDKEQSNLDTTLEDPVRSQETDHSTATKLRLGVSTMTRRIPGSLKSNASPATSRPMHVTNFFALSRTVGWLSSLWRHGLDGNLRAIQDLISQGLASPFDVQPLGGTVLHYAADHGHWDLCKFLIGKGALLDNEDSFHNTPTTLAWEKVLSGALTEDEASVVSNMFADTDFMQTRQFSVVHKIVLHLIPRTIESELDYSTRDLDAVDSSGRTPIAWAAVRGDELALNTLVSYGADVNLPDGQGNTPLHHARNAACVDILLAAGADKTARNTFGHTPLHIVCRGTGSLPLLRRLVTAGIDIDATDKSGETALATATFNSHVDCAFHLVHSGANINIANRTNDRPIHLALISDVPAVLQLLLDKGAKYQEPNSSGRTILHYAAGLVSAETIQVLKGHGLSGIDVNARDLEGKTVEDILDERVDDDSDPLFKSRFHDMLESVKAAQSGTDLVAPDPPSELAIEMKGLFGLSKNDPVVRVTSVGADGDDDVYDCDNDTHGASAVFFDAVEEIQQGLQAVAISA
ncbi:MAG: hypothetical protein Q9218_007382, partial [Villophora microphyllina]